MANENEVYDWSNPLRDRQPVEGPGYSVEFDTEGLPPVTADDIVRGGRPSREPADKQPVL